MFLLNFKKKGVGQWGKPNERGVGPLDHPLAAHLEKHHLVMLDILSLGHKKKTAGLGLFHDILSQEHKKKQWVLVYPT